MDIAMAEGLAPWHPPVAQCQGSIQDQGGGSGCRALLCAEGITTAGAPATWCFLGEDFNVKSRFGSFA